VHKLTCPVWYLLFVFLDGQAVVDPYVHIQDLLLALVRLQFLSGDRPDSR